MTYGSTTVTGDTAVTDDQWHHLAAVIDRSAGELRLYVDGVVAGTSALSEDATNTAPLEIGGWSGSTIGRFKGMIDEVAVYDRGLLASDIQALIAAADRAWLPAALSASGAGTTEASWTLAMPSDLEGIYQIDLRGTDPYGNRRVSANVWRGAIDLVAPRITFSATPTGASFIDQKGILRYGFRFVCSAEDQNLDGNSFVCSDSKKQPSRKFDSDPALLALFPDIGCAIT